MRFLSRLVLLIAPVLFVSCSSSSSGPSLASLSEGCSLNSDCDVGLLCVFGACHDPCASAVDCAKGARCVVGDRPFHVCQLASEASCETSSQCAASQICASDGQCRDGCASDQQCLPNEVCATGACAEMSEVTDGGLPVTIDGGGVGQACVRASECPGTLLCLGGTCLPECANDKDCDGGTCTDGVCHGGAGGSGGSGGAAGAGGSGGAAIPPGCGNGQIDPGETCDAAGDARCSASCQVQCLMGEVEDPATHDCYALTATKTSFEEARTACMALGGDLALPKDAAEEGQLSGFAPGAWIGALVSAAGLTAFDGEALLASYAQGGQEQGTCAALQAVGGGWAATEDCATPLTGVCAIPPKGTPAPGTCGDGHVDPGEECDAPGKIGCVGCQVVCDGMNATKDSTTHHCYFVVGSGPWSEASQTCAAVGAYLAVIDTDAEDVLVSSLDAEPWISATDAAQAGVFLTAAGQPVPKTYWGPNQPATTDADGKPAHCVKDGSGGVWSTADCNAANLNGVCERDPPM